MSHNYSSKKENLLWKNHCKEKVGKKAKHGQKQGVLFTMVGSIAQLWQWRSNRKQSM
jgi:hypothetical protein